MNLNKVFRVLGPGLLYAGAAVGVSHLVQSTRAGATYGLDLLWVLVFVNLVKYPFFEFGSRYATATGNSLVEGYKNLGKWAIILFGLITLFTMFIVQAAITKVTAGLAVEIFQLSIDDNLLCLIILALTMLYFNNRQVFTFGQNHQVYYYHSCSINTCSSAISIRSGYKGIN